MKMTFRSSSRIAAIAVAATVAFAFIGAVSIEGFSNAAFAGKKGGNGGGNNGDKGGNKGGNGNGGGNREAAGNGHRSNGHGNSSRIASAEPGAPLHPSEKGKWNANPNQNAIDAHIRNQNFNGTVGALSMFQLSHELQEVGYDALNEDQQAAVDTLYEQYGIDPYGLDPDQLADLESAFDDADYTGTAVYSYTQDANGIVSVGCEDGGSGDCSQDIADMLADQANLAVLEESFDPEAFDMALTEASEASGATYSLDTSDGYATVVCTGTDCDQETLDALQAEADAIEGTGASELVAISEDVIRERSNKTYTPEKEETLLDGIASDLGVARDNTVDAVTEVGDAISDAGSALLGLLDGN
jgi:hypothetical protein